MDIMSLNTLNHSLVRSLMEKSLIRPVDLARKMRVTRQLVNYIMCHGGVKYARDLADIFDVTRSDLLVKSERNRKR